MTKSQYLKSQGSRLTVPAGGAYTVPLPVRSCTAKGNNMPAHSRPMTKDEIAEQAAVLSDAMVEGAFRAGVPAVVFVAAVHMIVDMLQQRTAPPNHGSNVIVIY